MAKTEAIDPTTSTTDATRVRLLEATSVAVAQYGPRKLSLTDIAAIAGVSRPTVYRYFASKDDLLVALADHEKTRFEAELAAVLHGSRGEERLDRALRFIVDFQRDYSMRGLVVIEPAFMLGQLEQSLRTMAEAMEPLFGPRRAPGGTTPADIADLVVRIALSHFLIRGDDAQLLRQLRHVAGIRRPVEHR